MGVLSILSITLCQRHCRDVHPGPSSDRRRQILLFWKVNLKVFKKYRVVSSTPFLSKVLECLVLTQLINHEDADDLLEPS